MQDQELTRNVAVWYGPNGEIDSYRDLNFAEMTIRRTLRLGFGPKVATEIAENGDLLFVVDGVLLPHYIRMETRSSEMVDY